MKFKLLPIILISSLFSCDTKTQKPMPELPKAPLANQISKKLTIHDDVRVDEFYWLNDRETMVIGTSLNLKRAKIIQFTLEKKKP